MTDMLSHRESSLRVSGSTLCWRDISVSVPLKSAKKGDEENAIPSHKTILNNVSGYVEPGQLLFIMGPSGSGKSTILDALADRVKLPVEGVQTLDGKPKTATALKRAAKYVQQTDDLLGVLTVRETLETSAGLYVSEPEKRAKIVDDVIKILGMTEHENTKIGNAFVRGLSGGQIRRVSIGCELVATPQLLFLDEPTSGLDSATAYNVMAELKKIAEQNRMAMVITVHQPSEIVFEMADTLLLISGGNTCFFGPADKAAGYFEGLGFPRNPRCSDIEWMLDLINKDYGQIDVVDKCIQAWSSSTYCSKLQEDLENLGVPKESTNTSMFSKELMTYPVGFLQQTKVLTKRGILNTIRNPAVLWLRFGMYIMLALLIGLVWLRLGTKASRIVDTNNALFYICAFMIFMSVSVLPAYLEERSVLIRERANGAYSVGAYLLSHTLYEIPYVLFLAISASSVCYWMVGLNSKFSRFIVFIANMFTSLFVAESMMVLLSAVIPILIVGIAAGAMTFGLFMCVMGAFVSVDRIGWWIRWVRYIALHFYSYSAFLVNQFEGMIYTPDTESFPQFLEPVAGETVYRAQGLEERLWVNFVAQIAMIIVYRAIAGMWLHFFLKGKK